MMIHIQAVHLNSTINKVFSIYDSTTSESVSHGCARDICQYSFRYIASLSPVLTSNAMLSLASHMFHKYIHCKKSMVILTNKNGYLSYTFVLSTLGTEQRYKECTRCVGYHPGGIEW